VNAAPKVNSCDGEWRYDPNQNRIVWMIDLVDDSNRNGSMEVVVGAAAPDSFFPCTVAFSAGTSICDIAATQCLNAQTQAPVKFGQRKQLAVTKFEIVH
jgi:hypothetical protein